MVALSPEERAFAAATSAQGMISPFGPPFVDPNTGAITTVSFRFLYELRSQVTELLDRVATLEARLSAAGIP